MLAVCSGFQLSAVLREPLRRIWSDHLQFLVIVEECCPDELSLGAATVID